MSQFDLFYTEFPRKKDKAAAERAFNRALKRATFEEIMDGVRRYRNDPLRSPTHTKYPATWLNADSWLDEPDTPWRSVESTPNLLDTRFDNEPEGITLAEFREKYATEEERAAIARYGLSKRFA